MGEGGRGGGGRRFGGSNTKRQVDKFVFQIMSHKNFKQPNKKPKPTNLGVHGKHNKKKPFSIRQINLV